MRKWGPSTQFFQAVEVSLRVWAPSHPDRSSTQPKVSFSCAKLEQHEGTHTLPNNTHTPKLLVEFGANLPHQRLIVKIFCLISVSHSLREQKQQRGRNLLPLEPVVSTSFIIYPKRRAGFVLAAVSFWKSPDFQVSWSLLVESPSVFV